MGTSPAVDLRRCQEAVAKGSRLYLRKRLKALQSCRNLLSKGKSLFLDGASTVGLTDPANCANEFKSSEQSAKAGVAFRKRLANPAAPRCTDALVGTLALCASTVDGLVNSVGDAGCLITTHQSAANDLVNAEYGP